MRTIKITDAEFIAVILIPEWSLFTLRNDGEPEKVDNSEILRRVANRDYKKLFHANGRYVFKAEGIRWLETDEKNLDFSRVRRGDAEKIKRGVYRHG